MGLSGFNNSGLGVRRAEARCTAHQASRRSIKAGQSFKRVFESECQWVKGRPITISTALPSARSRMQARRGIERAFR
jgi:hypothetical protein